VIRLRSVWHRSGPQDLKAANKTVEYLARYANRVAISNSRLIAIEGDQVLFSYKDYRDGGQWKTTELHGVEFIRRFLQHVLPPRLRHIGHEEKRTVSRRFCLSSRHDTRSPLHLKFQAKERLRVRFSAGRTRIPAASRIKRILHNPGWISRTVPSGEIST